MEFSKISVLAITLCVACFVTGDLSEDRVSDAWAEFYKSYYEQHSGAEDRDLGGFGAPSSSYAEPAAPSTGYGAPATSYDSPAYGASFSDVKGVDLLSPETTVCFNCYNLQDYFFAIATNLPSFDRGCVLLPNPIPFWLWMDLPNKQRCHHLSLK